MSRRKIEELKAKRVESQSPDVDLADQVFWDEFWMQENKEKEKEPLYTITIRNQKTGEEQVIQDVKLKFRSMEKIRELS